MGEWKNNHISNAWLCLVHHNDWLDLFFKPDPRQTMIPGDVTPKMVIIVLSLTLNKC